MKKMSIIYFQALLMIISLVMLYVGCKEDQDDTIRDIDGNAYNSVLIGNKLWMKENLRTTKFRDGSAIPLVTDSVAWTMLSSAAFCWPENNSANKTILGGLYNGYAVNDPRGLAPKGWHIATDADWFDLEIASGLPQSMANTEGDRGETENVGGHLKSLSYWDALNLGADNSSGFTALGTGYRRPPGEFDWFRQWTGFYTSTTSNPGYLWMRYIGCDMTAVGRWERPLLYAYSVRCVKD